MTTVLLVEDDPMIAQAVAERLVAEGFDVVRAADGPGAVTAYAEQRPDLVVLDLMLPGFDGLEVCRRIQSPELGVPAPVLMLTARDEESDLLTGFGVGADDYLTKPFRMKELLARLRALLRRVERAEQRAAAGPEVLAVGDLTVDAGSRRAHVAGAEVHLTPTEFDLLLALAARPGRVVTRDELLREVWGWSPATAGTTRTVDSHVKALRAKVGPERIRTSHGVGYALEPVGGAGR
ncbi:response regulator transcription factor [Alteromonas gracilis]